MNQPSLSRHAWAFGGLAGTLLVASVGCSQSAAVVRNDTLPTDAVVRGQTPGPLAQNPDLAGHNYRHDVQYVNHEGSPIVHSESTIIGGGDPNAYGAPSGAYCPPGYEGHGGAYCPPGYGHGFGGVAGQSYTYEDPGMPVYPAGTGPALTGPGSPGAIIQYPYYTTKGPDDFFLDQDGRF